MLKATFLIKALSVFFLSCLTNMTMAAEVADLYSAKVAVESRDRSVFEQGLRDALLLVLQKSSSSSTSEIEKIPSLAADLQNGHRYVEQYAYQTVRVINDEGQDEEKLFLKATFPASVITEFLQRGNLSYWSANRPATLVMPVIKIDGTLHFNDNTLSEQAEIDLAVKEAAYYFGIPLANKQQHNSINKQSLQAFWQWNVASLEKSTTDINKDAMFVGRIAATSDGRFIGGWMLVQGDSTASIDITAKSLDAFVHKGFAWLSNRWVKQYSVKFQLAGNEQVVHVSGVDDHKKYSILIAYLESLDVVDQVYVLQVERGQLTLAVDLKSDAEQFFEIIELSRYLKVSSGQLEGAHFYDWQLR